MVSRFIDRRQQKDWSLETAILQTIAYFSIFKYPLTDWEVWSFLPQPASLVMVRTEIKQLIDNGQIGCQWGYYFLPGQEIIADYRQQRYSIAVAKIKKAQRVAKWLRWLPGVQFVALANIMGSYNLRTEGDLDLFIITKPGCLWFCRFWSALILQILGLRPTDECQQDKICLSFWLTSDNLNIDQFRLPDDDGWPDWYYIYWLANLRPLIEQGLTYRQVIKKNPWLKAYLPNWRSGDFSQGSKSFFDRWALRVSSFWQFQARFWEKTLYHWQKKFLPNNIRQLMNLDQRVVVSEKVIKLHVIDRRDYFRQRLKAVIDQFKKGVIDIPQIDQSKTQPTNRCWLKLSDWFSAVLVLLLPWSTRWIARPGYLGGQFWEYGTISLYGTDLWLILTVIIIIIAEPKIFYRLRKTHYFWWLIGFWLISFVGSLINQTPNQWLWFSWLRLVIWSSGWLVVLIGQNRSVKQWLTLFLVSLVVPASLGLGQFVGQFAPANKWLGLAEHQPAELGVSVIESIDSFGQSTGRWLRAYGSFDQPNVFGGLASLALLLTMVAFLSFKNNSLKPLWWGLSGLFSLALMASWSRTAILVVMIGWFVYLMTSQFQRLKPAVHLTLKWGLVVLLWLLLWLWPVQDLGFTRLAGQARLEQKSLTERQGHYQQAGSVIKNNLWWGVGLGNYTRYLSSLDQEVKSAWDYQPIHNTWLLIVGEVGLIGFIWLAIGMIMLFWQAQKNNKLVWTLGLMLFFLLLMDHWWWSLHIGIIYFWFWLIIVWKISQQQLNLL